MKTPEEKIHFKNHFFKLGQGRLILPSDDQYWLVFWRLPRQLGDVFDLLTPYDVHTVRDQNLPNFLLFVRVLAVKIVDLTQNFTPRKHLELLNCLRLLAKLIPFVYELPDYATEIETRLFWSQTFNPIEFLKNGPSLALEPTGFGFSEPEHQVLAVSLTNALVQLLLMPNFTIEQSCVNKNTNTAFWEPGIGCLGKYQPPSPIYDSNRVDVLRALIALTSVSFYDKPTEVISKGSRFLTLLVTCLPKNHLVSLVCSLFNITCRSARKSDESGLMYENISLSQLRYLCVNYSVQLLTCMLVYPMPSLENTSFLVEFHLMPTTRPPNMARAFFGKLSKESEFLFIAAHLLNILRYPFQAPDETKARTSKLQPSPWVLEAIIILWELLQCNKNFTNAVADRLVLKLVPYLLYYVFAFFDVPQYANIVQTSAYFLFYISSQESLMQALIAPMSESVVDSLPPEFKPPHHMSTRDFSVIQICTIISLIAPVGPVKLSGHTQTFLMPTLVDILYNIIPITDQRIQGTSDPNRRMSNVNPHGGLSYAACVSLTQLLVKLSTKAVLIEKPGNGEMLAFIVRTLCSAAIKHPSASRMLLFSFLKNEKIYDSIWNVIYSLESEYFYGENMKLMNVREDEEMDPNEDIHSPTFQKSFYIPPAMSPDQQSLSRVTTNEDHPVSLKDSLNSLNTSNASIVAEESEHEVPDEEKLIFEALRPLLPTGMSLKAKEKLPQDSTLSQTWGGNDALRIIITILIPSMKQELEDLWSRNGEASLDNFFVVLQIESLDWDAIISRNRRQINYDFLPDTPVDKLSFQWSHYSLGWYASVLFWEIYNGPDTIKRFVRTEKSLIKNISSSIAVFSKFASSWSGLGGSTVNNGEDALTIDYVERGLDSNNIWESTSVKLLKFRPSDNDKLLNAFGLKFSAASNNAVDITNSLARRFSDFRMTNRPPMHGVNSFSLTLEEQPDGARLSKRNSVSSLHSLNTLNRSRSNTPRNSFSNTPRNSIST